MTGPAPTAVESLTIILCGYETIRKSACLRGANPALVLAVPICCYLLRTRRGPVLFDTGFDSAPLADPAESRRRFVNAKFPAPPLVLPEHELLPQLASIGIAPADVIHIVLSHAHGDHIGHLRDFPNAVVTIQRREYEAAFSEAERDFPARAVLEAPGLRWSIVDGDHQLMPGLDLVLTGGHRPGHQSAAVTLPSGAVKILTGDVADLVENFEREVLGSSLDDDASLASIRRLNALARERGGDLVPLHDPSFVQTAKLLPLVYD